MKTKYRHHMYIYVGNNAYIRNDEVARRIGQAYLDGMNYALAVAKKNYEAATRCAAIDLTEVNGIVVTEANGIV